MKSMTAYARAKKGKGTHSVQVTLRSLNYKYAEVSVYNLPAENILLEEAIKREIKKKVSRGKVEAFIFLSNLQSKKIIIDEKVVSEYIAQIKKVARKNKVKAQIGLSSILSLPQTICCEQKIKGDQSLILPAVKEALAKLVEFRKKEGKVIEKEMLSNLGKIRKNIIKIKKYKPKASKMENGKEDIDEELSLMSFYISKLEAKIKNNKNEPKGKSIDFLTQEILRELNAASSKTKKKRAALLIVEAKNYLERVREQTQNVE